MSLRSEYAFVLPRGYVDHRGVLHTTGTMRLATARDELAPLRDPLVTGPDDPRLTVLVLARVVTQLGTLELITPNEIEGLFAVDLAYLQDFYGVINFGTQEEYEALLRSQQDSPPPTVPVDPSSMRTAPAAAPVESAPRPAADGENVSTPPARDDAPPLERSRRAAIEEIPAGGR